MKFGPFIPPGAQSPQVRALVADATSPALPDFDDLENEDEANAALKNSVTFFTDHAATTKREEHITLEALAKLIHATAAPTKEALPWLKLARFGDACTDKGSLRHNANVVAISGVEGDYDRRR